MVSSFLGNTGRAACLPGVAENEENDEDFANGDGFEAKSRRNPLWIPRIFNAESGRVCRNILRQHRTIPALRLKHRSGGCGTASALPKYSIIHKVLSALLA